MVAVEAVIRAVGVRICFGCIFKCVQLKLYISEYAIIQVLRIWETIETEGPIAVNKLFYVPSKLFVNHLNRSGLFSCGFLLL